MEFRIPANDEFFLSVVANLVPIDVPLLLGLALGKQYPLHYERANEDPSTFFSMQILIVFLT